MFRQVLYIQGLPDLAEDTEIIVKIPARGGQNIPVEVELPVNLLLDPSQVKVEQPATPAVGLSPTTFTTGPKTLSPANLSLQSTRSPINPPISSPQSLLVGSGSPDLLVSAGSPMSSVSANQSVSPLRRDPSLAGTPGQQFLPSISSGASRAAALSPRNQSLPVRTPSAATGLPFIIPTSTIGSVAPTFQMSSASTPSGSLSFSRPVSATLPSSRPMTGEQLATTFLSSPSPARSPIRTAAEPTLNSSINASFASSSRPTTTIKSTSRLSRSSPSKASGGGGGLTVMQSPPSLSLSSTPTTISSVLMSPGMSGLALPPPTDLEEEIADQEEAVGELGQGEEEMEAAGHDLYSQQARFHLAKAGIDIDPDIESESINDAWNNLSPEDKAEWSADAMEMAQQELSRKQTAPACSPEKLTPSCNMSLLLIKYATPNKRSQ